MTKRCLEILNQFNWPVVIQTKSPLVLRDLGIFKKFREIEVGLTIPTADDEIRKIFEPRVYSIKERVSTLEKLHQEGVKTYAMIAPILPKAEGLADILAGKVDYLIIDKMNYHYADWIYWKYKLEEARREEFFLQKKKELISVFKKEEIPCQVLF